MLFSIILLNPENPFYYRALTLWPLIFISHIVVDKLLKMKRSTYESLFLVLLAQSGIMLISGSLKKPTFWFYEMWVPFIMYWFYSGMF